MTILALEDNRDLQLFYKKILSMWGHQVIQCLSLGEAREALSKGPLPDLILADLTLPDAPPDVLKAALKSEEFARVPIVLTSGREDLHSWGREIAARQVFLKPVDIVQLKSFLVRLQGEARPAGPPP